MISLSMTEIGHFGYVSIPNHSTETRQIRVVYQDDSTVISAPDELAFIRLEFVFTHYAIGHGKNVNENGT
jgi:hypothetical protein